LESANSRELNSQYIKLVKFKGPFIWHKHENEDEIFLVIKGNFTMEMRNGSRVINEGEFIIIPKGTEHKPVAEEEVEVMLFEPVSTPNTGNKRTAITKDTLDKI
jgi:mannose-6-phosphate isomerase-like protein (cupin superfamily)